MEKYSSIEELKQALSPDEQYKLYVSEEGYMELCKELVNLFEGIPQDKKAFSYISNQSAFPAKMDVEHDPWLDQTGDKFVLIKEEEQCR